MYFKSRSQVQRHGKKPLSFLEPSVSYPKQIFQDMQESLNHAVSCILYGNRWLVAWIQPFSALKKLSGSEVVSIPLTLAEGVAGWIRSAEQGQPSQAVQELVGTLPPVSLCATIENVEIWHGEALPQT